MTSIKTKNANAKNTDFDEEPPEVDEEDNINDMERKDSIVSNVDECMISLNLFSCFFNFSYCSTFRIIWLC